MKKYLKNPHVSGGFGAILALGLFLLSLVVLNKAVENHVQKSVRHLSLTPKNKVAKQKIKKVKPKPKVSQKKSLKPKIKMNFQTPGSSLGLDIALLGARDSQLLSQSQDVALTENLVDQVPSISFREPIEFPVIAKEKNINGFVTVNILVDKKGKVEDVKLIESQPPGVFEEVATEAVKGWMFEPARLKGQTVSVWVKQKIDFKVN